MSEHQGSQMPAGSCRTLQVTGFGCPGGRWGNAWKCPQAPNGTRLGMSGACQKLALVNGHFTELCPITGTWGPWQGLRNGVMKAENLIKN